METQAITSLEQEDWLIRASALRNDLTPEQRDYLEKRLHRTLEAMSTEPYTVLETRFARRNSSRSSDARSMPIDIVAGSMTC